MFRSFKILLKPQVLEKMSQGGTKTFICSVDGSPKPTISWYRGSEVSVTQIFSAEKLQAIESGCYTCAASNSVGQSVSKFTQCLLTVIRLSLFKIHLFYKEICQNQLAIFLVPVFSYELCSVKITPKDLI